MSDALPSQAVGDVVDLLCVRGCAQVLKDIQTLAAGRCPPGAEGLEASELSTLRTELESIMRVYGYQFDGNGAVGPGSAPASRLEGSDLADDGL